MVKTVPRTDKGRPRVCYEATLTRDDAVSYLEAIVAGLRQGRFRLEHAGSAITLDVPGSVEVVVRARCKKDRERIRFEIAWRQPDAATLEVTAGEPDVPRQAQASSGASTPGDSA